MTDHGPVAWAEDTREKAELLLPPMRETARALGYALGVHGSLARDIDLIACPWTIEAVPATSLVIALLNTIHEKGLPTIIVNDDKAPVGDERRKNPALKPHGRLAWSIHLGGGPYIDLSVMPLVPARCPRVPACISLFDHDDLSDCIVKDPA